jgi:hypothetical protein
MIEAIVPDYMVAVDTQEDWLCFSDNADGVSGSAIAGSTGPLCHGHLLVDIGQRWR